MEAPEMQPFAMTVVSESVGADRYKQGVEDGKQAEYDRFWDSFQQKGNRGDYNYAFGGEGWPKENFKPKYDMRPTSASAMFYKTTANYSLKDALRECDLQLDFSRATAMQQCFTGAYLTEIGIVDARSAPNLTQTFGNTYNLKRIEKLIVHSAQTFSSTFTGASALEEITVEGEIGTALSVSACTKLTHDSLMSIIGALKSGVSATCTLGATNLAKLTNAEKAIATQKGWSLA